MPCRRRPSSGQTALRVGLLLAGLAGALPGTLAQPAPGGAAGPVTGAPTARPAAEEGPRWSSLSLAQREALRPLERDWPGIDGARKSKWLEIAERYPSMPAQDQQRLQARMGEWARMTPQERSRTRLQYQDARRAPQQKRQASWEAYQALPEEERRELASRARPTVAPAAASAGSPATVPKRPDKLARDGAQPKVNAVPPPDAVPPPRPVAPSVVQAQPGATTKLISKPATPPAHQPSGSPKIAATPEYVDKKTLLPQTGAQSPGPSRSAAAAGKPQQ